MIMHVHGCVVVPFFKCTVKSMFSSIYMGLEKKNGLLKFLAFRFFPIICLLNKKKRTNIHFNIFFGVYIRVYALSRGHFSIEMLSVRQR